MCMMASSGKTGLEKKEKASLEVPGNLLLMMNGSSLLSTLLIVLELYT